VNRGGLVSNRHFYDLCRPASRVAVICEVRIRMPESSLEERVQRLESSVQQLQAAIGNRTSGKDWRRTIGAFTDDAGMQEIFKEAMRMREQDRKRTRVKKPSKRKPRQ